MKNIRLLTTLILLTTFAVAQVSPKRGIAYGSHSKADMTVLSKGISWWYNWSQNPDGGVANDFEAMGIEYVPMFWNANFDVNQAIANIPATAKYILAFNEPNFTVESNMSPQQAVNNWGRIEQVAAARNLKIVSAAPAYCGGNVCMNGYTSPITWHDEFFRLCPTCKVDFIAFHNYEPYSAAVISLTNNLKKYGKPIWMTEFAQYYNNDNETIDNYIKTLTDAFEKDPDIYRYSWFTGRRSDAPRINLLGNSGQLTTLGTTYVNRAYGPVQTLPGKVEAESHYRRGGTGVETTTDNGGGQNIAFIEAGDWAEYLVKVTQDGIYNFEFRTASQTAVGKFDIYEDDRLLKTDATVTATGGYQTWKSTVVTGISLTPGEHLIRLNFKSAQFNMNYFNVIRFSDAAPVADFKASLSNACVNETVTFTDQSIHNTGGDNYAWEFGTGATPLTASGIGPHNVKYTSGGTKQVKMTITNSNGTSNTTKTMEVTANPTGCVFEDHYNNASADWITGSGSFIHTETQSVWKVANNGFDEWDNFQYELNNGTISKIMNLSCATSNQVVKVIARNSVGNSLLSVSLADSSGRNIDNYDNTRLELTTTAKAFEIDFAGKFSNTYGASPGVVNSRVVSDITFSINGGFHSYPYKGVNATYNTFYAGDVLIDWIGIGGTGCKIPDIINGISRTASGEGTSFPNPFNTTFEIIIPSNANAHVQIVNSVGETIHNAPYTVGEHIGEQLNNGFYTVVVTTSERVKTFKVVKN